MPSREIGVVFDPEIHGPGQMRFGFNGSRTLEVIPPISIINLHLHESGMFPDLTPEDLPPPEKEFSSKFLNIVQSLKKLGSISHTGEYIDRSDDEDPEIKETALDQINRIKALFPPKTEVSQPETDTITFLRETPLVSKILGRVDPRKVEHYLA